jgi:hypothetical protein
MSARAVVVAALFVGAAGCQRSPVSESLDTATASPAPPLVVPVDQLATGELLEGPDRAFGLALPRGVRVDAAFADAVYASGPVLLHAAALYFRARLRGGDMREGNAAATFEHVGIAGRPDREFRIHVAKVAAQVRIDIEDTTPAPAPDLPDDKARWRQVGLTPDGRLADPTHLD